MRIAAPQPQLDKPHIEREPVVNLERVVEPEPEHEPEPEPVINLQPNSEPVPEPNSEPSTYRSLTCAYIYLVCASVLWCLFIWGCSSLNATQSSAQSDSVVHTLSGFWQLLSITNMHVMILIVRKSAHVLEYMMLGNLCCMCACVRLARLQLTHANKTTLHRHTIMRSAVRSVCVCIAIAYVDEVIQLFVPGRWGALTDVAIDSAGILAGTIIAMLCFYIVYVRSRAL
jgi:hypothetical protein